MNECQTERGLLLDDFRKNKKKIIFDKKLKNLISKIPKIPKIMLDIPFSYSNILKKSKIKINKNILNNYSSSISNGENKNSNYILNSINNTSRVKIYQKKKIPSHQQLNNEEAISNSLLSLKNNHNKKTINKNEKFKKISNNGKKININSNYSQKYFFNDSRFKRKIKKYLNINLIFDEKINTINEGMDYESERKNAKIKSININNVNINLNSINNITNNFEFGEINNSISNFRSYNSKINDICFLRKLNFDQPCSNKNSNFINLINKSKKDNYLGKLLFKEKNKNSNRIKQKQAFIYKNSEINLEKNNSKKKNLINKIKSKTKKKIIIKGKNIKNLESAGNYLNTSKTAKNKNVESNKSLKNTNVNLKSQKFHNFESNLIESESSTISDNSISYIESNNNENEDSQIASEKDETHTVVTTRQLNLYLKKAKKSPLNSKSKNENKKIMKMQIKNINGHKKLEFKNILFSSINTNFKLLLVKFLDKKSLLVLSSLDKTFYNNFRRKIYKYFYDKIIKNNGNKDFILKILSSIQKNASKSLTTNNLKDLKTKYENYKRIKSKYDSIIIQDISRTFPNEPNFFKNSVNYKRLYNILIAYSNFNKNIGYAQGLNFLAARGIILFKNEENAFLFLDGLINKFNLDYFLSINNQKLPKQIKYLSKILNKYCINFINYLKSKLVNHDFFTTSWLLTLFSNSMDKKKLYICWCFMIIFGWKFFYSFIIQLILFYEKNLMKINEGILSKQMKELLKSNAFIKDFNTIMKSTLIFMENNIIL